MLDRKINYFWTIVFKHICHFMAVLVIGYGRENRTEERHISGGKNYQSHHVNATLYHILKYLSSIIIQYFSYLQAILCMLY